MGSEKTIEEKFEDYIKDNSMKRMYMIDYLRAGYDIAKSEDKEKIEKLKKALSFYAKPSVWGKSMPHCLDSIDPCDTEQLEGDNYGIYRGGKLARQVLKEIEE